MPGATRRCQEHPVKALPTKRTAWRGDGRERQWLNCRTNSHTAGIRERGAEVSMTGLQNEPKL